MTANLALQIFDLCKHFVKPVKKQNAVYKENFKAFCFSNGSKYCYNRDN